MNVSLIANLLQDVLMDTQPIPEAELSDDWKEFEQKLGRYKEEYLKHLREYRQASNTLTKMNNDVKILENLTTIITSRNIREQIIIWVEEYRTQSDFQQYQEHVNSIGGKVKAMERVLVNTNASRYSQFTCSICMDRYVDTFIDPCGHLACSACLNQTQTAGCPMCRSQVRELKRMFPTM